MNYLLPTLIAALLGATTLSITSDQVNELCRAADARITRIESLRDTQTIQIATLQWQLDHGSQRKPSVEELVEAHLIDPKFQSRETVADALKECSVPAQQP